jgi:phage-related protein
MNIAFDNVSLNNDPYQFTELDHEKSAPRETFMYDLARERGGVIVGDNYKPKEVVITGRIIGDDKNALESNIDSFKELMARFNKNLDLDYASGTRRYVATPTDVNIDRKYFNLSFVPFRVTFLVPSGVGEDITQTASIQNGITDSPYDGSINIGGSAYPMPKVEVIIASITAGIDISFQCNGDKITLTNSLVANDVIVFDVQNKKVTLNGAEKDYTGVFPKFNVGTNNYIITINSSARNFNVEVDYFKKWL